MTASVSPPFFYYLPNNNNTGAPAAGFKLFTYQAGTSTKQSTWTDSTQTTLNANPILLDANGFIAAASGSGLWGDPTLSYKFVLAPANDTDPPTSPIRTQDNVQFPLTIATGGLTTSLLTQVLIGTALYPQTAAELAATVTPINYFYPPGNVLRYGTNATPGTTDMSTPIANAIKSNDYVYFPSGVYLIGSQINVNRGTITIEGSNQNAMLGGISLGGTQLLLANGAGSGAACLSWNQSYYQSINIRHIGIQLNNPGKQQIGLRFGGPVIGARISECWIEGQGTASDDTVGIQLDGNPGSAGYTGDFVIEKNLIRNHLVGIKIGTVASPAITTLKIVNNELYGTSSNTLSSVGIQYGYSGATSNALVTDGYISGNMFISWCFGIDSYGSLLRQIGNYFEYDGTPPGTNYAWRWTRGTGVTAIENYSIADLRNPQSYLVPINGVDACFVLTQNNWNADNVSLQLGLGIGLFNTTPPITQTTGWGTPVGNAVINNYNITDAGGANSNTNKAVAQIIATLKSYGFYGA